MVSRFFAKPSSSPATSPGARSSPGSRGKRAVIPARLADAARHARLALDRFREVARKKSAHREHEDAAEAVLIPFRPFVQARAEARRAAVDGEVLCLDAPDAPTRSPDVTPVGRPDAAVSDPTAARPPRRPPRPRPPRPSRHLPDLPGAADAGAVLSDALAELDRLHVNASCRVRQRAPVVAEARARLTALRRECREAFAALDPRGVADAAARRRARKTRLPAARDAEKFAEGGAAEDIRALRARCPLMRETGSPHHLCLHLCYYREYDAARQLFVLRTRVAAAKGTASALNDWRADVRAATAEEMGLTDARRRERRRSAKRSRADADDEDDAVGADGDDSYSEDDSPLPRDARRGAGAREGGWLASKSLPWRVVFFSPEGDAFDSPAEVLAAVGVDASAVGPAAANENGGGGLGNETLADFQTNVAGSSPGSGPRLPGPVALGRVAPAPRAAGFALAGARGTHGGSGVRLARPEEAGLDAATDLLRAALWPKRNDASVGTEPVRRRLEAAAAGAPRSPFRLASDPLAVDASTERDRRGKGDARSPGGGGEGSPARSPGGGGGGASGCSRAFVSPPLTPTNLRQWWSPPRSPFGLLEEILWEDEWKLLVACMMLNCTTRLQVDRVLWRLFTLIPTPEEAVRLGREGGGEEATEDPFRDEDAAKSGLDRIEDILAPLGLHRKRARAFVRLSEEYLAARPNQALPAPDAPAGDESGRVAGESANSPAPPGSSQAPRRRRAPLRTPVASLHGVGAYASDAHAMFCEGLMGVAPRDHALRWWYAWAVERRESDRREAARRRASTD